MIISAIVPSSVLITFVLVVIVIAAFAYFRRSRAHQPAKDTNEYDTVDYTPPALPPQRLPKPSHQLREFSSLEMQQNSAYQQGLQLDKPEYVEMEQNSAYDHGLQLGKPPEYVEIVEY